MGLEGIQRLIAAKAVRHRQSCLTVQWHTSGRFFGPRR
jgi:hypothetical protein